MQHVGRLVGVLVVFLCLHVFTAPAVGWWVWVRFWVGYKTFLCCCLVVGGFQAHCRVHVQHRVSVRHLLVVVACAASLKGFFFWVWVVCGGLFVICIVVASIFVLYCFLCFV